MTEVTYKEAIRQAMRDALAADDSVFMLGEDIGAGGGVFKTTDGLIDEFGAGRVLDTPISEQAIVGAAIGAAARGLRPVAELMFADFAGVCFDQIANQLAKYRYTTGGQVTLPVTLRMVCGAGSGFASQHSQSVENWFLNCPGLKIVTPGSPADAYGLFRAAVADDNPVLFFEHKGMYNLKAPLDRAPVPVGTAAVVRPGRDVTVVATQLMRYRAELAAGELVAEGIEVELVDPRTLVPLDVATIGASVSRTNHLVVVQESPLEGSWGATVVTAVVDGHFESLDSPPRVVCCPSTPIPYAGELEAEWLPSVRRITDEIRKAVAR